MALDGQGHDNGVDDELRAWIKSLARPPLPSDDPDRYKLSDEAAACLHRDRH